MSIEIFNQIQLEFPLSLYIDLRSAKSWRTLEVQSNSFLNLYLLQMGTYREGLLFFRIHWNGTRQSGQGFQFRISLKYPSLEIQFIEVPLGLVTTRQASFKEL